MNALKTIKNSDYREQGVTKEPLSSLAMTIGHSKHKLKEFVHLLKTHGATCVVDVRTIPRSLHNAQFNKESLSRSPLIANQQLKTVTIMKTNTLNPKRVKL